MRQPPTARRGRERPPTTGGLLLRRVLVAFAMAAVVAGPAVAAPPAEETREAESMAAQINARQPHHAVRTLGALQERVAQGEEAALALQRAVVQDIADELKAFPPEVWQSVRNRQALIKFALSGGDPEQLRVVLSRRLFTAPELPLAEAALAYAEGQRSVALRLLDKVDIYELPPSLAGHVALVKAMVIANGDLARVIGLTDDARLLSPGTLVEETALRLAIEAAISQGNRAKFEAMALRYFRRFPRSPYLAAVIRPVAAAIAEGGYSERPDGVKWVHSVVLYLDPNKLVQFYSALADAGLRSAKLVTTINAARMAQKYVRPGSPEQAWALAYEGAALVVGPHGKEGLSRLAAAETIGVGAAVGDLIASARAMAKIIQAPPIALPASAAPAVPLAAAEAPRPPVQPVPRAGDAPRAAASTPSSAPAATPSLPGREPAAIRTLARIAQVDKLLKETEE